MIDPNDFEMTVRLRHHLALELLDEATEEFLKSREAMEHISPPMGDDFWRKVLEDFYATFLTGTGWDVEDLLN